MVISIFISLLIYVLTVYLMPTLFQIRSFDLLFLGKVFLITFASWAPLWSIKKIVDWVDPDAVLKVRRAAFIS
jgi:hypothetical protein